jgi:hypothetical protein
MNDLEQRAIGVLECVDEAGNVLLGPEAGIPAAGNPHFTISQRLGQMILYGTPEEQALARDADAILTRIQVEVSKIPVEQSHCLDSLVGMPKELPSAG